MGTSAIGVSSYRDLAVWKAGIELAVSAYSATQSFPKSETYGLTSQIRRSSTSIPANIAEGYGREHTGAYVQFLRIAQGSLKEFETHITIARRVGFLAERDATVLLGRADELGRMIRAMIRTLQHKLQQ